MYDQQPVKANDNKPYVISYFQENDGHSAVIDNAGFARKANSKTCPYKPGTENQKLWTLCRFGKDSDTEQLRPDLQQEPQPEQHKKPQRSEHAIEAAIEFERKLVSRHQRQK